MNRQPSEIQKAAFFVRGVQPTFIDFKAMKPLKGPCDMS